MKPEQLELLTEVVSRRAPELLPLIESIDSGDLSADDRRRLGGILTDELAETGFEQDYEANARGLALEDLIDWVGFGSGS